MKFKSEINSLFEKYGTVMENSLPALFEAPKEWEGKTSTLIVTDECNLRCTYCYLTNKLPNRMTWDVAKSFIDMTFKNNLHLADIPVDQQIQFDHGKIWDFVGGEPFLEADLVFKCMEYISEKTYALPATHPWLRGFLCKHCPPPSHHIPGFRFSFSSNGTLLTDPVIRKNLERFSSMTSLGVTIDGPREMHDACRVTTDGVTGSYDTVMESWEWYRKTFPVCSMTTKSTICHENLQYINTIARFFWEDLKMPYVSMNCVFENVWWEGDQLVLFDQICDLADYLLKDERWKKLGIRWFNPMLGTKDTNDGKWCGAGTHMDACGYDGTLYPCLRFKAMDTKDPYRLGHVRDGHKDEVALSELDVKNCHMESVQKEHTGVDCASCAISALCSSCQAFSYDTYGRTDVKAPFLCPMHKADVFANMYFMGNLMGWLTPSDRDYLLMLLDDYTRDDYFGFSDEGIPNIPFKKE